MNKYVTEHGSNLETYMCSGWTIDSSPYTIEADTEEYTNSDHQYTQ